jgi:hypothetical protein
MKKIINGRLYNTETAKKCGEYEPNPYRSDFNWFCESLYQKKTGEFFLHGDGNAASPYSKSCGQNEWCGTEIIKPMSYTEAQEWAERHLTGDQYEEIFGEVSEDDTNVKTMISTTAAEIEIIKRNAAKAGMTVSAYIVMRCAE